VLQDARPPEKAGRQARMPGECSVWDITISAEHNSKDVVQEAFEAIAKKWAFQLEAGGTTGYRHYQCRISLVKKKTQNMFVAILRDKEIEGFHVSPTSSNACKGAPFYVMKEDTRVEGPWTDKDEAPKPTLPTVELMHTQGLRPWQNSLLWQVDAYENRKIHIVVDVGGNVGKGAFCKYCWFHGYGQPVPPMTVTEDIVQFVMCQPPSKLYLIDLPRAMPKDRLAGLYAGIESLKDGQLYDKRYKGTFKYIPEPNIIVFTNKFPKMSHLSPDRWIFWSVVDYELVPVQPPRD